MKSGLFTSGGMSITYGDQQTTQTAANVSTFTAASTVGSTEGHVALQAGNHYAQVGSNVLAPQGDIQIAAQRVDILEAQNASQSEQENTFTQSGLTLALSSPIISAVQTIQQMKTATDSTRDTHMKALGAGTAALAAKNAVDAVAADPQAAGGISLSITVGSSSSESTQTQTANTAQGSTVAAGGDVSISATRPSSLSPTHPLSPEERAGGEGDLTIQGSTVSGHNVTLAADDAIKLLAAQNSAEQHSKNSSQSAGVGVAISYGSGDFAAGITANASAARGKADGSDVYYTNTHVAAANHLSLTSGGDTTVKGAVASGKQVIAAVGGNLTIESLQDTSKYDSKQQSIGGSVTVGYGVAASFSASQSKINSDYASVIEQSGIKAGDEGFQVTVNGNTDLKGAVIASTQAAVTKTKTVSPPAR